jgi:hypothetical protein
MIMAGECSATVIIQAVDGTAFKLASLTEALQNTTSILSKYSEKSAGDSYSAIVGLMQVQQQVIANQLTIMQLELAVVGVLFAVVGWVGFKELKKYIFSVIDDIIIRTLENKGVSQTLNDNNKLQRTKQGSVNKSLTMGDTGSEVSNNPKDIETFKKLDYDPEEGGKE